MTNPLHSVESTNDNKPWPRTVAEAVARLVQMLDQDQKDAVAAMPEEDLIFMHFALGEWIRNDFGLWRGNEALLADCQWIEWEGREKAQNGRLLIHPDDASMVVVRALWVRLKH